MGMQERVALMRRVSSTPDRALAEVTPLVKRPFPAGGIDRPGIDVPSTLACLDMMRS